MRVAIIPARGGSRRIPGKNIKPFYGKPIIVYSIEAAKMSGLFDAIIVSTDDQKIAYLASEHGAMVFMRSKEMSVDEVGTQDVAKDAIQYLPGATEVCVIYATAPLMMKEDLQIGWDMLRASAMPYVHTANSSGLDAGQWYWGKAQAFGRIPLEGNSQHYYLPANRVCDINTPEDWDKCAMLYAQWHHPRMPGDPNNESVN